MFKTLKSRLFGFETPKSFTTAFANQRIPNLTLSSRVKVVACLEAGIEVLDIDRCEERFLLSGSNDGGLCIYDLQNLTGKWSQTIHSSFRIPRGHRHSHKYSVETLQWYPFDTGLFTSSSFDRTLKIWDTNNMKPAETVNFPHRVVCHHMSPIPTHSSLIAVALANPHLVLVDTRTGLNCHELRGHNIGICTVRWSPSCDHLLATGGMDSKILFWDVRNPKGCLRVLDQYNCDTQVRYKDIVTSHSGFVNGLRFTDDGLYLVSYGTDDELRLWDVALCKNTLVNYGSRLVNDSAEWKQKHLEICCDTYPPVIFVLTTNRIILFDLFNGNPIKTLKGHMQYLNCCQYRSNLNQLYSGGCDSNILVWSADTKLEKMEHNADVKYLKKSHADSDGWSSDDDE